MLSADSAVRRAADDWLYEHEPQHSSMLRTPASPNVIAGGYCSNVIPSEARATLDVRMLPDEDPARFAAEMRKIINDPAVGRVASARTAIRSAFSRASCIASCGSTGTS